MIAEWMLYCALCALGLFVAAAMAERLLLAGRRAVRPVWLGAVLLSLALPVAALRYGSDPRPARAAVDAREDIALDSSAMLAPAVMPPVVGATPVRAAIPTSRWRALVSRADRPLLVAWLVLSIGLAIYFVGGMIVLALMRRSWRRHVVLDVPVLVSERVGPALVGAMSPAIVLPEWVLDMEPRQLALMLKHEQEHRRARDGQVLTVAQLALIAMPWNVALWWQVLRLRTAVELDCDARVLRDADARSYGDLLLEVVRPSGSIRLMGATAFAERASQLERRIRVLAKPRNRVVRGSRAAAALIGVVVAAVAWAAPRPETPLITLFAQSSHTARAGASAAATTSQKQATPKPRYVGDTIVARNHLIGDSLFLVPNAPDAPGAPNTATESVHDDSVLFHRLLDGITPTASQQAAAHAPFESLTSRQLAVAVSAITSGLQSRSAIIATRDSALRALVSNDQDRALLASRMAPGARGRSESPPSAVSGGRGGRSGGDGSGVAPVEMQFNRLFNGITLTPEQASSARTLIGAAMQAMRSSAPRQ